MDPILHYDTPFGVLQGLCRQSLWLQVSSSGGGDEAVKCLFCFCCDGVDVNIPINI